jgi:hypothetical protein
VEKNAFSAGADAHTIAMCISTRDHTNVSWPITVECQFWISEIGSREVYMSDLAVLKCEPVLTSTFAQSRHLQRFSLLASSFVVVDMHLHHTTAKHARQSNLLCCSHSQVEYHNLRYSQRIRITYNTKNTSQRVNLAPAVTAVMSSIQEIETLPISKGQ